MEKKEKMEKKNKVYFTVTGLFRISNTEFLEKDMPVTLVKEPDNKYDNEAIMVKIEGIGQIGYVANSVHTVVGDEAYSAGRLYDKIGDEATAKVAYNMGDAVQCWIEV